jgi:hypothetical protein
MVHAMMMVDAIKKNYTFVAISPPSPPFPKQSFTCFCVASYAQMRESESEKKE